MFKLPVCPYCGTVYRYHDTKNAIVKKEHECYHCHQHFKVKLFPYVLIEAVILLAVSIGINLLILSRLTTFNLFPLFAVTIGILLIILLLVPFFTHFSKTEDHIKNQKKRKK